MQHNVRSLIVRWVVGACVGTLIIWATSPWFVRSYLPTQLDPVRQIFTPEPNNVYRWRGEGYANTWIGPHGMPGKKSFGEKQPNQIRIALWGDSQAEGVAVADLYKLFSQIETVARNEELDIEVLPLSRSGDSLTDWLKQIPNVETAWSVDLHIVLVADLEDLILAAPAASDEASERNAKIARLLPAFVIQGARYMLTEPGGDKRRKLRFGLGRVSTQTDAPTVEIAKPEMVLEDVMSAFTNATKRPVLVLYAPQLPSIIGGKVITADVNDQGFQKFNEITQGSSINVIDLRDGLVESANNGRWPHGFHNGQFGVGHLNRTGYRIIAQRVVQELLENHPSLQNRSR